MFNFPYAHTHLIDVKLTPIGGGDSLLKLKALFLAFVLLITATALVAIAAPLLPVQQHSNDITAFDYRWARLAVGVRPNGDGDPLPGGGVPK